MQKKICFLLMLFVFTGSMVAKATTNTFHFISHKGEFIEIYWQEAKKACASGNQEAAANALVKVLKMDPSDRKAYEMLKVMDPHNPYFISRKDLVRQYENQIEDLKKDKQLAAAEAATAKAQNYLDYEEQKEVFDQYKSELENAKMKYDALAKYSRLYRADVDQIKNEDLRLRKKIEKDFIEKEKLCSAVDKYLYVEKARLDYLDDLVLKQRMELLIKENQR